MKRNVESKFVPDADRKYTIDDRIYYSDISINKSKLLSEYQTLINAGRYNDANKYLENKNIDCYGAWVLNLLNNRLVAIIDYMRNDMEKPELVNYCTLDEFDYSGKMKHWVE